MNSMLERAIGAFLTAWLLTGIACAILVDLGAGHWIELFNGATWPTDYPSKDGGAGHLFCFYTVLALRTLLNLGVGLTVGWSLVVLLGGGIERFVMRRMESVLHGRDTALAGYLIKILRDQHINLPAEVEDKLMAAANDFPETAAGRRFQDEAKKAVVA